MVFSEIQKGSQGPAGSVHPTQSHTKEAQDALLTRGASKQGNDSETGGGIEKRAQLQAHRVLTLEGILRTLMKGQNAPNP